MSTAVQPETVRFAVELLLKTALLLLLAEGASRLLGRAPAAARHLVWVTAVLASLALPLAVVLGPRIEVPGIRLPSPPGELPTVAPGAQDEPTSAVDQTGTTLPAGPETFGERIERRIRDGEQLAAGAAEDRDPATLTAAGLGRALTWIASVWLLGAAAVGARVVVGVLGAWRLVRTADAADREWQEHAASAAERLGLRTPVRVLRSTSADVPMVWGVVRPAVVVPASADRWSATRRDMVLLHELGHVQRRDCLTQLFAHLATAVYWINPLAWRAAARLRSERELACDELVLCAGARGSDYARHLLEIARAARGYRPAYGVALPMARPSQLEGRLLAILSPRRPRAAIGGVLRAGLPATALAALLVVGALDPWAVDAATPETGPATSETMTLAEPPAAGNGEERQAGIAEPPAAPTVEEGEGGAPQGPAGAADEATQERSRDAVLDALMRSLVDADDAMRAQLAHTLGQMEDPRSVPALVQMLRDPSVRVRRNAAWALGMIESADAVEGLLAVLGSDEDEETRSNAAWALGMIESPDGAPGLVRAADDASVEVRSNAAWALGMIESESGVDAAARLLGDPESRVRQQAAWALGMIESPLGVAPLLTVLDDESGAVRMQAIWALGMIESEGALDALLDIMENDPDRKVRRAALEAVGRIAR